jgi:hypothetical protein
VDEVLRQWLSRMVLAIQRAYCNGLVNGPFSKRPELLHHLWKISRASDVETREMALADQEWIFNRPTLAGRQLGAALSSAGFMVISAVTVVALASGGGPLVASIGWLLETAAPDPDSVANYQRWREALAAAGLSQLDLLAVAAVGGAVVFAWTRTFAMSARIAASQIRALHDHLRQQVHQRMFAAYHELINASDGETLRMRVAPGLAGARADELLARTEAGRVRALAFDLGAGAIAISGGRGVGKTTLLRMLAGEGIERGRRAALVVNVAAPVKYHTREFLLHLHAELAAAVLDRLGAATSRRVWVVRTRALLRRLANGVLLAVGLMALFTQLPLDFSSWLASQDLPVPDEQEATLLLLAVTTWLLARATNPAVRFVSRVDRVRNSQLTAQARRHLERVRFLQTVAVERHGLLGPGRGGLQLGWRRSRQLSEQPMTLPELVASYRTFAATVALWWHESHGNNGKLLIGIDEVDRIVDADLAELFLNETKAIFGVPHCVYIVSVSDEALANFERRVVRVRTVFDSAFDETIRLAPLAVGESVELLRRRLVGVPDRFLLLCHCLAGGMPRDVLKMARTMLHIHLEQIGGSPLVDIARELVAREIATLKRGFLSPSTAPIDPALAAKVSADSWPGTTPQELATSIRDVLGRDRQPLPGSQQAALGAAIYFYTTVLELFTNCPTTVASLTAAVSRPSMRTATPDRLRFVKSGEPLDTELRRWLAAEAGIRPIEATAAAVLGIVDSLDHAYQVLQTDSSAAIAMLAAIRKRLGLQLPIGRPNL